MELHKEREEKAKLFFENLKTFEEEVNQIMGLNNLNKTNILTNDDYKSEIENEIELQKLERSLARINKFARRELESDESQHPRREKRMTDRAVLRKVTGTTHKIYTESELQ